MRKFILPAIASLTLLSGTAYAQNCEDLETNKAWNKGLTNMQKALTDKDYDTVLKEADKIYDICDSSPYHLYMVAMAYEAKGNKTRARDFIFKAADATYTIATPFVLAQKIWYKRYEYDNPEYSALQMSDMAKRLADLESDRNALNNSFETFKKNHDETLNNYKTDLAIGMWTGVGVAGTGIALGITGAILLGTKKNEQRITINHTHGLDTEYWAEFDDNYIYGIALTSVGISLAVVGSALTGVFGYKYTHFEKEKAFTFALSPNQASFGIKF